MAEYKELLACYGGDTLDLMVSFIDRLKNGSDKRTYAEALRLFNELTGSDPVTASEAVFAKYVRALGRKTEQGGNGGRPWKHSTALKNRKIISSFVRYCLKLRGQESPKVPEGFEDRLMYSPMRGTDETYHFRDVPSVEDIDRLFVHLRGSSPKLLTAFIFSFRCFLRPVNFIGAVWSDIYTDSSGEFFLQAKGRSALVHIPRDCVPYIEKHAEGSAGRYIFPKARTDEPCDVTYLDGRLRKACADAGIGTKGLTLNALRNAAAVYAASNGATPEMLAESLDLQTTRHFSKLTSLTIHFSGAEDYVGIRFSPPEKDDAHKSMPKGENKT